MSEIFKFHCEQDFKCIYIVYIHSSTCKSCWIKKKKKITVVFKLFIRYEGLEVSGWFEIFKIRCLMSACKIIIYYACTKIYLYW